LVLTFAICFFFGSTFAEIYKWTDENGVLHMATSIADVPEKYRDQVLKIEGDSTPSRSTWRPGWVSFRDTAAPC
jgi:hypothetical protein